MTKILEEKEQLRLGENIKKYLKDSGLSKSDLVKLTGLDYHTIVKIERGVTPDPRVHTVAKIASALNVSVDDLITN